ncbi:SusC/RagA family TonB-linked outer membrane protein [Mucilaginibacter sp. UR6-1]|uniref:SusC/RagA family TonB-linked outer membrane protein n=1 Tax=Mucilaginibacter sp. UR6-1 TaxID=1435643 RepID=UPI001E388CEB|nr:SusC/RagA family TonB-linked outer membrane protein [Mucilaginibacter sp. UR6-1]MCC8408829.1 SusC/RagA family TonB-linked outer membrane protein [Mucilaginibacter sp. UR6-1]
MKASSNQAGVHPHVKKCTSDQGPPLKKATIFLAVLFSCLFSIQAFAQKKVTGTVFDKQKLPLPGATIKIKGSTTAVATDMDGKFNITVPGDNAILTVSSIGFTSKDVPVGTQTNINVTLLEESRGLNTVVVVGYGAQKKGEITSATGHADTSDFRQSGARNPLDLIQGKIAGLQISRSGSNPNTGTSIQLRGVTTLTGSASPLVVIDGIPGGNLDLLQQDDIASIDVLKDGSGAAIYGTSANAGVILVTTKKGKEGPPQFSYSSYYRKEYLARIPDFMDADQFRARLASGELRGTDYGHSNDFFDQLVNHGNLSQNHNLALTGGTSKTSYRASLNYRDLQGFAKENGRKEYSVRLSVNQKGLNDKLNMQVNLAGNFGKLNLLGGSGWEDQLIRNPTLSNYNDDGTFYFERTSTNQFARLQQETNKRQQSTISADGKAEYEFIPGLKGSVFGSVQRNNYIDGLYRSIYGEFSLENDIYRGGGYAERTTQLNLNYAFEPTIQYNKVIADDHNLTAILGYSYRYNVNEGFSAGNYGFLNDRFMENNLGAGNQLQTGKAVMSSFKNDDKLIAFFGRVNYAYKDKYLLQLTLRREGSSRFGANNKWGYFPAASAGWTISQEDFMKDVNFVNNLKLRVGYGVTGNSGFSNYASLVTLGTGGIYLYPDGQYRETYGPDRNPNPNLRYEKKKELNIGADFTLFNNRITGAIDVFQRKTQDLLDTYTTPQPPYVRNNIYANVGTISAKGIEIAVSFAAIKHKGFTWNMDLAASTTKNTLDSYSDDIFKVQLRTFGDIGGAGALGNAIRTYEGGPLGEFWGKRFAGFTEDGKWLFYTRNGEKVSNDKINNSEFKDQTDLAPIGNAIPKYYASWTNNFKYKNFDLRLFFRGKFDFDILNTTAIAYGNKVSGTNLLNDAFTKYAEINDTYMYSDYYLENGSFLKLDEVTFGYNFKIRNKTIRNLRAYVTGQNLLTITSYSGNDPDFVPDTGLGPGIDGRGPYPSTRSFLLGISLGF